MEMHDYEIIDIQGDYAQLKILDSESENEELFPVALVCRSGAILARNYMA